MGDDPCDNDVTHVLRWDEKGAGRPAFACDLHAPRNTVRRVQTVNEWRNEVLADV